VLRLAVRGVTQEDPEAAVLERGVVLDLGVGVRRVADVHARLAVAVRDIPRVDAVRGIELRDAVLVVPHAARSLTRGHSSAILDWSR